MALPLMPKATAVWLVEHTSLTFEQIADFCGLHRLEGPPIADGGAAVGMQGLDPVVTGQIVQAELDCCLADPKARLKLATPSVPRPRARPRGARYTPVSKRQDRPDAIAWLIKNYPELSDGQISRLIGTTKPTITAVREKSHWNASNIKPQNPIGLGLCGEAELEKAVYMARARAGRVHAPKPPRKKQAAAEAAAPEAPAAPEMPAPAGETPAAPKTSAPETPAPAAPETPTVPEAPAPETVPSAAEPLPGEPETEKHAPGPDAPEDEAPSGSRQGGGNAT